MALDTLLEKSKATVTEFGLDATSVLAGSVVGYAHAQGIDLPQSVDVSAFLIPVGLQGVRYLSPGFYGGAVIGLFGGAAVEWLLGGSYIEQIDIIKAGAATGAVIGGTGGFTVGAVLGGLEATVGYGLGYAAGSLQKMV